MSVPIAAALSFLASHASADAEFELGFRTGYGLPLGKVDDQPRTSSDGALEEVAVGQIPLWLDIGARIGGQVFVGGYFAYGIAQFSDELAESCHELERSAERAGGSGGCSLRDLRLGAEVLYHFGGPATSLDPWIGAGIGYEWISENVHAAVIGLEQSVTVTARGFEFLNLQAGLDVPVSDVFAVGPFVGFTFAVYKTSSVGCTGDCGLFEDNSQSIDDTALHHWLFLGVRGTFVP